MGTLRVCHLGKYYPPAPGGIESHVRTLAQAQAGMGMEVRVLCVNHEAGPTVVEHDGPVKVTRLGRSAAVAKLDVCPDLGARLARVEADILHLHVPNPTMILGLLWVRPGTPIVVTYHSDVVRQRVLGPLFRPVERLAYRRVRAILATSPIYPTGSRFLRPTETGSTSCRTGLNSSRTSTPRPTTWPGPRGFGHGTRAGDRSGSARGGRSITRGSSTPCAR